MTSSEFETFLQEMEPDIRAADHDMREIEALDQKGVAAAGRLVGACHRYPLASNLFMPSNRQIIKNSDPASKLSSKLTNRTSSSLHPWRGALRLWLGSMEPM